jgi:hypothetical protein
MQARRGRKKLKLTQSSQRVWNYTGPWPKKLLIIVLCGGGTWFFAHEAQKNALEPRGLVVDGIFRLSPEQTSGLYGIFCGLFGGLLLFALLAAAWKASSEKARHLELTETALILPQIFRICDIPYAEIKSLSEERVGKSGSLIVHTAKGKYRIFAGLLDEQDYRDIKRLLAERVARFSPPTTNRG